MDRPIMVAELGSGGMADVFLAMRRGMGGFVKLVVIKRLREGAIEGDAVTMFHDEARISARLNHPNVIQTHEVGFDGDHYRLEMEYLDGQPLHRIVNRAKKVGRAFTQDMAVAVVREVLAGLHYAHELSDYDGSPLGIVHRDVSPQNVFVTYDGRVKLVDFGIAKVAGQAAVTQVGMVKGKVRYMAPEQATGRPLDRRADVFAAGVVLWQLLTGRGYWADCDDIGVFHRLAIGALPPGPRSANVEIPVELEIACMRALAVDPSERYATAEEFHAALEPFVPAGGSAERSVGNMAAELFADTRAAIKLEIEKAAARPHVDDDEPPTRLNAMAPRTSALSPEIVAPSDRPVSSQTRRPAERHHSSRNVIALIVVAASAVIALQVLVLAPRAGGPGAGAANVVAATPGAAPAAPQPDDARAAAESRTARGAARAAVPEPQEERAPGNTDSARAARAAPRTVTTSTSRETPKTAAGSGEAPATPVIDAGAPPIATAGGRVRPPLILDSDPWDAGVHR